jgi:membrane protein
MRGLIDRLLARLRPVVDRFVAIGVVQASVVLAAQAFMALIPLLIGIVAVAPAGVGESFAHAARTRLGFGGQTEDQVEHLVNTAGDGRLQSSLTTLGLVLVLFSATSFTRALQRVYEAAWQVPKGGLRGSVRGLVWLIGLVAYLAVLALALKLTASRAFGISALRTTLLLAGSLALWWLTPFVLLCGRVRLRALTVTAVLTAAAMYIAGWISTVIMPRRISSSERQYGTIGVAFTIESWLVVMGGVIVGAAMLGALAAQAGGRLGALARGTHDPDGWRREPKLLVSLLPGLDLVRDRQVDGPADHADDDRSPERRPEPVDVERQAELARDPAGQHEQQRVDDE